MRDPESGPAALPRFWKIPVIQEAIPKRTSNGLVFVAETNSDIRKMFFVREALAEVVEV